jgi:hypothetical protein
VASIPADHVYVAHLADPAGADDVVRLPEPRRDGPAGAAWWPSPLLSAEWVRTHADDFDVAHVHFGFDGVPDEQLARFTGALDATRRPLVFTVHDLRNPHHHDRIPHDRALDILLSAASEVITLTPGAADEIRGRFGRDATVVPHPHVVPRTHIGPRTPSRGPFTVGVHLKSLRANMFTLDLIDALADTVAGLADARLRVDLHDVVGRPGHHAHDPGVVQALDERRHAGRLDLRVHRFFTDEELWHYLASLDVSVLPYRFGTHSGWLEACADLGTTVVAPRCGWYHQQQPVLSFDADEDGFAADQLAAAVVEAHGARPIWQAGPTWRQAQRRAIASLHRDLYRRLIG